MRQQPVQVRRAAVTRQVAQRQAGLHAGGVLRDPADIAGREAPGDKAVQRARLGQRQSRELVFHAIQEAVHAPQPGTLRHARLGAVRADQIARIAHAGHMPAAVARHRAHKRLAQAQFDPVAHQFGGQPAHQPRRIRGVEVIARRAQVDAAQLGRVQPHLLHPVHAIGGRAAQPGLLDGFLDQDAGGVELVARIGLAFQHQHAQAGACRGQGAGGAGKAGAGDDDVVVEGGHGGFLGDGRDPVLPAGVRGVCGQCEAAGQTPCGWLSFLTSVGCFAGVAGDLLSVRAGATESRQRARRLGGWP
ncbi:hypothetical protein D9M72_318170 [compost metagenome]